MLPTPDNKGLAADWRLGLAASEDGLQLTQHLAQVGQRFAVAGPVAAALRRDGALVQLGCLVGEIRGAAVAGTGSAGRRGGSRDGLDQIGRASCRERV